MASQRPNKTKRRAKDFLADFSSYPSPTRHTLAYPGSTDDYAGVVGKFTWFWGSNHWKLGAQKKWSALLKSEILNDSRMSCSPFGRALCKWARVICRNSPLNHHARAAVRTVLS